jgi:hypothetical protein
MIYSIVIFRDNQIIHHERLAGVSAGSDAERLLLGMLSAVRGIVAMLSSDDSGNRFESLATPEYRLDYYETPTGYSFCVLSSPDASANPAEIRSEFEKLYNLLFIPLVIRNPLFHPRRISGDLRDSCCLAFVAELRNHFKAFSRAPISNVHAPVSTAPQLLL